MTSRRATVVFAAATCCMLGLSVAAPADARRSREQATLAPTGADPDATGNAIVVVRSRRGGLDGKLDVRVRRLEADQSFDVTLDGVALGTLQTNRRGKGVLRLRSRPRGNAGLLGVDPRGRSVAVVDANGAAVLGAGIPNSTLDPSDVRCCLPDDSGTECEDRTAAECAAEGGVDMGVGSCLPNPCTGSTPPGGDVVCCLPDDSGPECEDRTAAECAAQGGIVLDGTSCTPNPCAPMGPGTTIPGGTTTTTLPGAAVIRVTCERRSDRSRASVDGNNLASGSYGARITSGANVATAVPRATVGDEVEHDFDSEPDDIAAGAVAIAADFLVGTPVSVTGQLLDAGGGVVAEATVSCELD